VAAGEAVLNTAGIPTFKYPDRAAQAFNAMWRYSMNLDAAYETPSLIDGGLPGSGHRRTEELIGAARERRRVILTQHESKEILADYGLPVVLAAPALTESEAVARAQQIGFPVALKLHSETITHKRDAGGVRLNVRNATEVGEAWHEIRQAVVEKFGPQHFLGVTVEKMITADGFELILGSAVDAQFGPVILFGAGGRWVEVIQDRAIGFPPLTSTLSRRLMEQTRICAALKNIRGGAPIDWSALEGVLVRFSQLVAEQRWIKEIDINPLLATASDIVALDARIILHDPQLSDAQLPTLALRPYPHHYTTLDTLTDGTPVKLRSIRPEDEPMMIRFYESLSDQTVARRYFVPREIEGRSSHEQFARLCFIDYDREVALVAIHESPMTGQPEIIGLGRLIKAHGQNESGFAVVIGDQWRRRGLGTLLLRKLVNIGREERLAVIRGFVPEENEGMRRLCERTGFALRRRADDTAWEATVVP